MFDLISHSDMNMTIHRDDDDDDDCAAILNEDLVFLILSYLPVISLLRFKFVCKSWYSLIQSSSFINFHLTKQKNIPCKYFVVGRPPYPQTTVPLIMFSSDNIPTTKVEFDSPDILHLITGMHRTELVMLSCDGLVCMQMRDPYFRENNPVISLFLWNPATRHLLDVPQSPLPPIIENWSLSIYLGFGFDINSNDHKLVRIFLDQKQVEIYSLNTNSWRNIDPPSFLPEAIISYSRVPYQNSICCWQGRIISKVTNDFYDFIFTFDVNSEVFGTMDLPVVFDGFRYASSSIILTFIREKIAVLIEFTDFSNGYDCYEVWVLNHFGHTESWAKLYKFGPFIETRNLGLSEDGNFVIFVNILLRRFCLFNVVTQETEEIPVQIDQNFEFSFGMMALGEYNESLVSVKRGNDVNCLTSLTWTDLATVDTIGPG